MITLFSWFFIPCATLLLSGCTDWFTSNFSVTASTAPKSFLLIFWAFLTGGFFRYLIRCTIRQAGPVLPAKKELFLTDLAIFLLIFSVFVPYIPERKPFLSVLHVALAFTATVLFYIVITMLDLKLYFRFPGRFSMTTGLLIFAASMTAVLLLLSGFLISSALELFLTVFASLWLHTLYHRVKAVSASGRSAA